VRTFIVQSLSVEYVIYIEVTVNLEWKSDIQFRSRGSILDKA
jgi:hypothetical protein